MKGTICRVPGLILTDHEFIVPLNHSSTASDTIAVYGREVVAADCAGDNLPWLLFLQGGPGFSAPRPLQNSGWLRRATQEFRVLLLDQRGTGRSSPISVQSLKRFTPLEIAEHLKLFRADSIVADCEWIRRELAGDQPWSVLGQSYGGFCATHYVSQAPEGLREVMIAGGLPPLHASIDEVYRHLYGHVLDRNRRFYDRYPADVERAQCIVRHLLENEVVLPCGDTLTPARFQQLGLGLGTKHGFETLHYLLEEAFVPGHPKGELPYVFLSSCERAQPFDTHPLYSLLHEACYAKHEATDWAAQRTLVDFPEFHLHPLRPVFFTGEMIYPWLFEDIRGLRPLHRAAHLLANCDTWPELYRSEQLQKNTVPCAAIVYADDMYVVRAYSEETARTIRGIRLWLTSEYDHDALRTDGEAILGRLIDLVRSRI